MTLRTPKSVASLEELGRVRLSPSFYFRDFLYSEVANYYGVPNLPDDPDLAIEFGTKLCQELLEPLQQTFGRVAIRSAYRSTAVNALGNERGHNCASNEANFAAHIWDKRDAHGLGGAMACIVLPWFADRFEQGADWRALAYWIHNHLPYSKLTFFPNLCAFNIGWHQKPARSIYSYIEPRGLLLAGDPPNPSYARHYSGFPAFAPNAFASDSAPGATIPAHPDGSYFGGEGAEVDAKGRLTNGRIMLDLLGDEPDVSNTSLELARELGLPQSVLDRLGGNGALPGKHDSEVD